MRIKRAEGHVDGLFLLRRGGAVVRRALLLAAILHVGCGDVTTAELEADGGAGTTAAAAGAGGGEAGKIGTTPGGADGGAGAAAAGGGGDGGAGTTGAAGAGAAGTSGGAAGAGGGVAGSDGCPGQYCASSGPFVCVDVSTSLENCGSCGHACGAGQTCTGGTCRAADAGIDGPPVCATGYTWCGVCTKTATDRSNCGSCGHACGAGQVCTGGACGA